MLLALAEPQLGATTSLADEVEAVARAHAAARVQQLKRGGGRER